MPEVSFKQHTPVRGAFVIASVAAVVSRVTARMAQAQETRVRSKGQGEFATCQFWGGTRQVSDDDRQVIACGTKLCRNPCSLTYNRQTRSDRCASVWQLREAFG